MVLSGHQVPCLVGAVLLLVLLLLLVVLQWLAGQGAGW
jgi:hypothetical protein